MLNGIVGSERVLSATECNVERVCVAKVFAKTTLIAIAADHEDDEKDADLHTDIHQRRKIVRVFAHRKRRQRLGRGAKQCGELGKEADQRNDEEESATATNKWIAARKADATKNVLGCAGRRV